MVLKKFPNRLIGEILVEEGCLETANLKKALEIQKKQGGLLGEILVSRGWIKEEELLMGLSKQLGLPFIRLGSYNLNRAALKYIPQDLAVRHLIVPFECDNRVLSMAMFNPLDQVAIKEIEKRISVPVQIFLASSAEIKQAIEDNYKAALTEANEVK